MDRDRARCLTLRRDPQRKETQAGCTSEKLLGGALGRERFLSQNTHFPAPWKQIEWPEAQLSAWVITSGEDRYLVLASKTYARWVQLSTPEGVLDFEDNYFDLWPGEEKSICLPGKASLPWLTTTAWNLPGEFILEGIDGR